VGNLILKETKGKTASADEIAPIIIERIKKEGIDYLPWNEHSRRLCAKIRFVKKYGGQSNWPDFQTKALEAEIDTWLIPLGDFSGGPVFTEKILLEALKNRLGWENLHQLDTLSPEQMTLPSGPVKI